MRVAWHAVLFATASILFITNATIFFVVLDSSEAGRNAKFARYYISNVINQPEARFCAASDFLSVRVVIDCGTHKAALSALMGSLEQ